MRVYGIRQAARRQWSLYGKRYQSTSDGSYNITHIGSEPRCGEVSSIEGHRTEPLLLFVWFKWRVKIARYIVDVLYKQGDGDYSCGPMSVIVDALIVNIIYSLCVGKSSHGTVLMHQIFGTTNLMYITTTTSARRWYSIDYQTLDLVPNSGIWALLLFNCVVVYHLYTYHRSVWLCILVVVSSMVHLQSYRSRSRGGGVQKNICSCVSLGLMLACWTCRNVAAIRLQLVSR